MAGGPSIAVLLLGACVCVAAAEQPAAGPGGAEKAPEPPKETVVLGGQRHELELAADPQTRRRGLAGRETIEPDGGVLFVFPHARRRSFWMKGCLIDIDLLFLDRRGRIVSLHEMNAEAPQGENEPWWVYERRLKSYWSRRPAQFAIELKAGSIDRLELKPGVTIELDLKRLKELARENERRRGP